MVGRQKKSRRSSTWGVLSGNGTGCVVLVARGLEVRRFEAYDALMVWSVAGWWISGWRVGGLMVRWVGEVVGWRFGMWNEGNDGAGNS